MIEKPVFGQAKWVTAARSGIASLGVVRVALLADLCKPPSLAENGLDIRDILDSSPRDIVRLLKAHAPAALANEDRRRRFDSHLYVLMPVRTSLLRLWPGADGLPRDLTDKHSVEVAARLITENGLPPSRKPERSRFPQLLSHISNAAEPDAELEQLSVIPPIVMPEFHQDTRSILLGVPLTLDDGNCRALTLAVNGRKVVWCLVGVPLSPTVSADTRSLLGLIGVHPADRVAAGDFFRSRHGRWLLLAGFKKEILIRSVLASLPDLRQSAEESSLTDLSQRAEARRTAILSAQVTPIPDETVLRTVESLVSVAEHVARSGAIGFVDDGQPKDSDHVRLKAGAISRIALEILGAQSFPQSKKTLARAGLLALVTALKERKESKVIDGIALDLSAHVVGTLMASAGSGFARRQQLARETARAALVSCDAAQVDHKWDTVEADGTTGLAALLSLGDVGSGTGLEQLDIHMIVRLLNRIGVSYRARHDEPTEGLWWAQQAPIIHLAVIAILARYRPSDAKFKSPGLKRDYYLMCFTAITNLASAWTDKVTMVDFTADAEELLRARMLLIVLRDSKPPDRQGDAHDALHGRTRCAQPELCLPSQMLERNISGTNSNYRRWNWVLVNDLAEINWRIYTHELKKRQRSNWAPTGKRPPDPFDNCLTDALVLHRNAISQLQSEMGKAARRRDIEAVAAYNYWRWIHQKNLAAKVDSLLKERCGKLDRRLNRGELARELRALNDGLPAVKPHRQIATLDAHDPKIWSSLG